MLHTQYRCHPDISAIANQLFYNCQLNDGITSLDRPALAVSILYVCLFVCIYIVGVVCIFCRYHEMCGTVIVIEYAYCYITVVMH